MRLRGGDRDKAEAAYTHVRAIAEPFEDWAQINSTVPATKTSTRVRDRYGAGHVRIGHMR